MLDNVHIVLVGTRYPENVGSVARACANMGCPNIVLVRPERWDFEVAAPLARAEGKAILERVRVEDDLAGALAGFEHVYGTTARTGGWRKGIMTPAAAAPDMALRNREGRGVAVVFGPEDRGLSNEEIQVCGQLLTIPTTDASSLNVSQAVLVILYECYKAALERPFEPAGPPRSRLITHQEREVLYETLKESLLAIDYLRADNTDYWMLPVRRLMQRMELGRHEFNLLMGVCRQMMWVSGKADGEAKEKGRDEPGL